LTSWVIINLLKENPALCSYWVEGGKRQKSPSLPTLAPCW